jgi:glutamyl-tRNA synthetase
MTASPIVTRFAPSPTGALHLGNVRTALFNALLATRDRGRFLLRIEDTDAQRSRGEFREALLADLRWLELPWDEGPDVGGPAGPYRQSQRAAVYHDHRQRPEAQGRLYPCYCTPLELDVSRRAQIAAGHAPRYAGTCRDLDAAERAQRERDGRAAALRFRVPGERAVQFEDLVHGPQAFAAADIGDFIVRRSDGAAAFFFSNALDDALMSVTHVLRGEDHLSNTPRQILLLEALELSVPRYGHLSMLLGANGSPLSKRDGASAVSEYRERGYLPIALRNWLFRLGHAPAATGLLAPADMARAFDLNHLGRAAARCDPAQLEHWQREAVKRLDGAALLAWLAPALPPGLQPERALAFARAVKPNCVLPQDAAPWRAVVFERLDPLPADRLALLNETGPAFFHAACSAAAAQAAQPGEPDWAALTRAVQTSTGRRGPALFKPLRIALTGQDHGPELGPLLRLMPHAAVIERLRQYAH